MHKVAGKDAVAGSLLSIHNISYQMNLMAGIRKSIEDDTFPSFVKQFLENMYQNHDDIPEWAIDALSSVNIKFE